MQTIYSYTNYRDFLRDSYAAAKAANSAFSYRYFARKAGFASPNFLKLVIDGKRNLSGDSIPKFADAFKLKKRERRFFEVLVQFNQASTPAEQHHYYEQLLEFPEYCRATQLAQEQYAFMSQWYYPVVLELLLLPDFQEDPEWISQRLKKEITPAQAQSAINSLLKLGLVRRNEDGVLEPAEQHLTTGDQARHAAAYTYHRQMMERAQRALRYQRPHEREFAAITMAITNEQRDMIKKAIREFRKVVLNIASLGEQDEAEAVYQLNVQLFGHTKV